MTTGKMMQPLSLDIVMRIIVLESQNVRVYLQSSVSFKYVCLFFYQKFIYLIIPDIQLYLDMLHIIHIINKVT